MSDSDLDDILNIISKPISNSNITVDDNAKIKNIAEMLKTSIQDLSTDQNNDIVQTGSGIIKSKYFNMELLNLRIYLQIYFKLKLYV